MEHDSIDTLNSLNGLWFCPECNRVFGKDGQVDGVEMDGDESEELPWQHCSECVEENDSVLIDAPIKTPYFEYTTEERAALYAKYAYRPSA